VRRRKYYTLAQAAEFLELERRIIEFCVREELVQPRRYRGRTVVTHDDLDRVRVVFTLTEELGVNLPGVEVALRLRDQVTAQRTAAVQMLDEMQSAFRAELEQLRHELERLRQGRDGAILDAEDR